MPEDSPLVPCKGCGVLVLWAEYVKPPHKRAPLVRPERPETTRPNVIAFREGDRWFYRIASKGEDFSGAALIPMYVNHFSNCPNAKDFKK